jgi:hypothetical protein
MQYSALIYEAAGLSDVRPSDEQEEVLSAHRSLQQDAKSSGTYRGAVQLSEAAPTTIRHKGEETLVTDGPFPETKELFVGFYLFDCETLDEALDLAGRIPISEMGRVEVRPIVWAEVDAIPA